MDLVTIADRAFGDACTKGGDWIACRPGCDECCRRPFAITREDAERLLNGLKGLNAEAAAAIRARADAAWSRMKADFPGDAEMGTLTDSAEWREWFFARHQGTACPVLDEASGACTLYAHRPICCRIYGPWIEIGGQVSDPCHLCYEGASDADLDMAKVTVELPHGAPVQVETVIAYALSGDASQWR